MSKLKKLFLVLIGSVFFIRQCIWANMAPPPISKTEFEKTYKLPLYIYKDKGIPDDKYVPFGWKGVKVDDSWETNPYTGKTCIKIMYAAKDTQEVGWVGIYWRYWQYSKTSYNLTGAKVLSFWARGEKGNEVISEFKIGGIEKADSDLPRIGPLKLTTKWKKYIIKLEGKDLGRILNGCSLCVSSDKDSGGVVIYLDDIKYEN